MENNNNPDSEQSSADTTTRESDSEGVLVHLPGDVKRRIKFVIDKNAAPVPPQPRPTLDLSKFAEDEEGGVLEILPQEINRMIKFTVAPSYIPATPPMTRPKSDIPFSRDQLGTIQPEELDDCFPRHTSYLGNHEYL